TRSDRDWSSDVCSSDLERDLAGPSVERGPDDLGRQAARECPGGDRRAVESEDLDDAVVAARHHLPCDSFLEPPPQAAVEVAGGPEEHAPLEDERLVPGAPEPADHTVV